MAKSMRKRYRTRLEESLPEEIKLVIGDEETVYRKYMSLRYGENPHQPAAFYSPEKGPLTVGTLEILKTGKGGLSQTNVEDINNSLSIVHYFDEPACAVMKHVNPSGVAAARGDEDSLRDIYVRARDCDSLAAFGSVVGFNTKVDDATADEILSTYVEVVVAPDFDDEAMAIFEGKKDLRVIQVNNLDKMSRFVGEDPGPYTISTQMDGSIALSTPLLTKIRGAEDMRFVTEREATPREIEDLIFSWYVCMHVRSNKAVLSKDKATIGIGTGQQDRVMAVKLALDKAVERGNKDKVPGSVLATGGYFPFRDSIDLLAEYGVTGCLQPGGSIRDKQVIRACNEHGIAMAFTDERCFRHF
ncbi:MAG: IMP cyclohydrolase [Candidatus Bathyarchaeota archaeon]|nr:MAG: IMP cyclohydrolase [Candidatus Bathyarchaeota archaeon]